MLFTIHGQYMRLSLKKGICYVINLLFTMVMLFSYKMVMMFVSQNGHVVCPSKQSCCFPLKWSWSCSLSLKMVILLVPKMVMLFVPQFGHVVYLSDGHVVCSPNGQTVGPSKMIVLYLSLKVVMFFAPLKGYVVCPSKS